MKRLLIFTGILLVVYLQGLEPIEKGTDELNLALAYYNDTGEMMPILIELGEQYGSDKLYLEVKGMSKNQRREHTVNQLKLFSNRSQSNLKTILESMKDEGLVLNVNYLWISNLIGTKATVEAVRLLDKEEDVYRIIYDPPVKLLPEIKDKYKESRLDHIKKQNETRNTAYNVSLVRAPDVWEDGYTGQDIVVAVLDTGVNYNHQDLQNRMWTHPDYPNHGYDFVNDNNDPMDYNSHGTHCAGTVAGDGSAGTQTGIAPGSLIMAVQVLGANGSGNMQQSLDGVQFALNYGADILSMSYGWADASDLVRYYWRAVMSHTLSAGVIAAVAAGNEGHRQDEFPIPANVRSPGDCPPPWLHPDQTLTGGISAAVTVGATDSNDNTAAFSSRGPLTWSHIEPYHDYPYDPEMGLIKPDISAPGVSVNSLTHNNNSGYTLKSGTSMAAPAVAGILALMLSKNPELTPEEMSQIIEETSVNQPETKSNSYGAGRIDALNALAAISPLYDTVVGDLVPAGEPNEDYSGEIGGVIIVFSPDNEETAAIDIEVEVSNDPNHESIARFSNPSAIGRYFKFAVSAGEVFRNGKSIKLGFDVKPNQMWFRQGVDDWSRIPDSYLSYDNVAKTLSVNLAFITDGGHRSEIFEFAGDSGEEGVTLPVELSSFTAAVTAGQFVVLTWITESESNMLGYRVYRSESNDISAANNISPQVIPAKNSSTTEIYSFEDREVTSGNSYYYWLETLELDLSSSLFGPVSISLSEEDTGDGIKPAEPGNKLIGVFPNPFNISTTISFDIAGDELVCIVIYNLRGQIVRNVLTNAPYSKGNHRVVWDGKDNEGIISPTGIYLYRLETANGFDSMKKMLLLK